MRGRSGDLDLLDLVPTRAQAVGDGVDGFCGVEFGFVLAICEAQVVSKCDLHVVIATRYRSDVWARVEQSRLAYVNCH